MEIAKHVGSYKEILLLPKEIKKNCIYAKKKVSNKYLETAISLKSSTKLPRKTSSYPRISERKSVLK